MPRRLVLGLIWLGGTACAALLATIAVVQVGNRLTDSQIAPLSGAQVAQELAASHEPTTVSTEPADDAPTPDAETPRSVVPDQTAPDTIPAAAVTTTIVVAPTTTTRSDDDGRRASTTVASGSNASGSNAGGDNSSGGGSNSGSNSGPGGGGGPGPSPSTTAPAAPVSRTFSTVGGTVVARCTGAAIAATAATPNSGFRLDPSSKLAGTDLDVKFLGDHHESRIRVTCSGGAPSGTTEDK